MSLKRNDPAMFDALMADRRSVRGFQPRPIEEGLLRRIFSIAALAPSNCNVQPWVTHVVSGASAERMREALHAVAESGASPTPDVPLTGAYPDQYRIRQIDTAKALFAATGVARDDVAARKESLLRNFRFFDAPHAAFIFTPKWAGVREVADCGIYAQSLMLALTAHGLASCPQGSLSHYADVVHRQLGLDESLVLLFGIAFGYEDVRHPANATRVPRAPLELTTTFHG